MYVRKCVVCGKMFTSSRCNRITCSEECKQKRKKQRETEYYQNNREKFVENHKKNYVSKKKEYIKFCLHCKKGFSTNQNVQKYCSKKCQREAHRPKPLGKRMFTCEFCGNSFGADVKRRFCSKECRENAARSSRIRSRSKKPKLSLAQINELARKEGLNYGQYVAKYGL